MALEPLLLAHPVGLGKAEGGQDLTRGAQVPVSFETQLHPVLERIAAAARFPRQKSRAMMSTSAPSRSSPTAMALLPPEVTPAERQRVRPRFWFAKLAKVCSSGAKK